MSNRAFASAARLAAAAAALLLAGAQAAPVAAATEVSRVPFQVQIELTCGPGSCSGLFSSVKENQRLEIEQVLCRATLAVSEEIFDARVDYPVGNGFFFYSLGLDRRSSFRSSDLYVFGQMACLSSREAGA